MKIKYIPILISVVAFTSCNDFLDVKPVGKLIPTEVAQFENLLNNTSTISSHYIDNNGGCGMAFFGDNFSISENQANYSYVSTHPNLDRYAAYIFYEPFEDPNKMSYTWENGIYKAAGLFNNVVDGIEDLGMKEDTYAKGVMAQAKAGRAWSYLVGGLGYGPMYNPGGANDVKTIPYRTAGEASAPNPPLSTTAELFELLKTDLDYAVINAPKNAANPVRANKAAAYALRALYWMYMRNWTEMYNDADEAWKLSIENEGSEDKLFYNYSDFYYQEDASASPRPGEDVEIYLQLKYRDGNTDFNKSYSREHLFYRACAAATISYPSDDFIALFDKDTDLRYKLFMLKSVGYSSTVGGVVHEDGVRLYYIRGSRMLDNEGITYPELLLMRAEAQVRNHQLGGALSDLNTLRKYRYSGTNTDLPNGSSLNEDQLLEEILKERRREMPLGSFQRVFDLRRYVLDSGKPWSKTTITHKIGDKTYSAPIDDAHFTMKIKNTYIRYNPQWGLTEWEGTYDPKSGE